MLPASMTRRRALLPSLAAALALAAGVSACGEEEADPAGVGGTSVVHEEAVEGEPLELGELSYNVQITRFLNPDDPEDREYVVGLPEPESGVAYLGVFMVIENDSEEALPSADEYTVTDTLGEEFELVESESPYALDVGIEVPAEGELPLPNTTAATGPNQGSMLVFEVADSVSENRPLQLEVDSSEGSGGIVLDI
jgi:hypothetical protein